jgi:hypothetical protein
VGHSFGAIFGGILSGVEKRVKAFVLMAGTGSFTGVAVLNIPDLSGQRLENYSTTLDSIDPILLHRPSCSALDALLPVRP